MGNPNEPAKTPRDEPVSIPLDPEDALGGLLQVNPESEPAKSDADEATAPVDRKRDKPAGATESG
jgi:hypothetical protein